MKKDMRCGVCMGRDIEAMWEVRETDSAKYVCVECGSELLIHWGERIGGWVEGEACAAYCAATAEDFDRRYF